jgi:WD40 repeat protein
MNPNQTIHFILVLFFCVVLRSWCQQVFEGTTRASMGCSASVEESPEKYRTGPRGNSIASDGSSKERGNNFTTTYASGAAGSRKSSSTRGPESAYKPGSSDADTDAVFEKWKSKNEDRSEKDDMAKTEKIVEDFVYGDFKVDPQDVQQQRVERCNRIRKVHKADTGELSGTSPRDHLVRRVSGRDLLALSAERRSSSTFVMNDFTVKTIPSSAVDEVDDAPFHFLHEVKVPPGFRPLQRYHVRQLMSHASRVKVLAIAPNETEFVSCAMEDQVLGLYGMNSLQREHATFSGHSAALLSAAFSKDGKFLATSARDNTVNVWNLLHAEGGGSRLLATIEHPALPICVSFTFNSLGLVSGCQDKKCRVWELKSSFSQKKITTESIRFDDHDGVIVCVATHPSNHHVVTGGGDRTLRLWDSFSGASIRQFIGHDGIIISVSFTPDGSQILSNDDRSCKMWSADTGACLLNVTLASLLSAGGISRGSEFPPPMPLSKQFLDRTPLTSKLFGFAPNGILGEDALNACKIGASRSVFTVSCLLPGALSKSYFAVACTNKTVYVVSCLSGKEELQFQSKAAIFALAAGREEALMFGDVFGNLTTVVIQPKAT